MQNTGIELKNLSKLDWIQRYLDLGWNPILLRGKIPISKQWNKKRSHPDELRSRLAKNPDLEIGIVTGDLSSGVMAIDCDFPQEIGFDPHPMIQAGALAHTTSHAPRILFYSSDPEVLNFSRAVVEKHPQDPTKSRKLIEILGNGRQFMAPPSEHPEKKNQDGSPLKLEWITPLKPRNQVLQINSLDELRNWLSKCIKHKWIIDELFGNPSAQQAIQEQRSHSMTKLRSLLKKILDNLSPNLSREYSNWYVFHCPFHPPDTHPSLAINKSKLYAVDYHEDRVFSLVGLATKLGIIPGSDGKSKLRFAPSLVLEDGRIVEQGYDGKNVYYIVYDPSSGCIQKLERISQGEMEYAPIMNRDVETFQVLLPSWPQEYGDDLQLIQSIANFLDTWHQEPDRSSRMLDVYYVLATWIKDLVPKICYRRYLGSFGTGKSARLEAVGCICYRPVILAGVDTEASLRRTFDLWRGTYLIDEADFKDSRLYSSIVKILNIGYDSKLGWYRCQDPNDPSKTLSFYVYGPKLLATRELFKDPALESRCLTSISRRVNGEFPLFRIEKFRSQALDLRNKLLMWRFRNYHRISSILRCLEDPGLKSSLLGDREIDPRVAEIIIPLMLIFQEHEIRELLISTAEQIMGFLKSIDPDSFWEERVPQAISQLIQNPVEDEDGHEKTIVEKRGNLYRIPLKQIAIRILDRHPSEIDPAEIRNTSRAIAEYLRKQMFCLRRETGGRYYAYIPEWFISGNTPPYQSTSSTSFTDPSGLSGSSGSTMVGCQEKISLMHQACQKLHEAGIWIYFREARMEGSNICLYYLLDSKLPDPVLEKAMHILEPMGFIHDPHHHRFLKPESNQR